MRRKTNNWRKKKREHSAFPRGLRNVGEGHLVLVLWLVVSSVAQCHQLDPAPDTEAESRLRPPGVRARVEPCRVGTAAEDVSDAAGGGHPARGGVVRDGGACAHRTGVPDAPRTERDGERAVRRRAAGGAGGGRAGGGVATEGVPCERGAARSAGGAVHGEGVHRA